VTPVGRRPGQLDTRNDIIQAAKAEFATHGYDRTSLRAVARAAGVDAALVHHYFDGKSDLFIAAMALPFDPRQVGHDAATGAAAPPFSGARVVEGFLTMWDLAENTGSSFASCMGAMAASPEVGDAMREFVRERVWDRLDSIAGEPPEDTMRRRAMVSSQLMGLAFARYLLRVPPISTATPAQIGEWIGPTLERYILDPID
jgi:AcrR family transcriptional regulator